jgi:hypothetical protein
MPGGTVGGVGVPRGGVAVWVGVDVPVGFAVTVIVGPGVGSVSSCVLGWAHKAINVLITATVNPATVAHNDLRASALPCLIYISFVAGPSDGWRSGGVRRSFRSTSSGFIVHLLDGGVAGRRTPAHPAPRGFSASSWSSSAVALRLRSTGCLPSPSWFACHKVPPCNTE